MGQGTAKRQRTLYDLVPWKKSLWHSTIFLNKHPHTYVFPNLVRQGISAISRLFDDNLDLHSHALKCISHTWLPIYQQALRTYRAMPPNDWSPPAVWPGCWAKSPCLAYIAPSKKIKHEA